MSTTVHPAVAQRIIAADRRNRRRKTTDALTRLAIEIAAVFIRGLWLMLAVGIIHHQWIHTLPTVGYGTAVAVTALLSAALVPVRSRNKTN